MRRRSFLCACGVASAVALAGCSSDGGPTGEVVDDAVDGIDVTDHYGTSGDDGKFKVGIDVENTGDSEVTARNYAFAVSLYGEGEDEVSESGGTVVRYLDETIPAGGTGEVRVLKPTTISPLSVERYEIRVSCAAGADGAAYCEG